jgi:phosphoribosylamine--glycine ligase
MIWRAKEELRNMLVHQKFGAATKVVIEEFLDGIELSCFVLTDGKSYKILQQRKITNALAKATLD